MSYKFNGTGDNVENTKNKVTVVDENSTDTEYPSAKAAYDGVARVYNVLWEEIGRKENTSNKRFLINENSDDTGYPSAKAVYDFVQSALYVDTTDEVE